MSLEVDGVWKSGVWATTVWEDGVWREGARSSSGSSRFAGFFNYHSWYWMGA